MSAAAAVLVCNLAPHCINVALHRLALFSSQQHLASLRSQQLTVSTRVWWQVLRGKTKTSPGPRTSSVGFSCLASGYFCRAGGRQIRELNWKLSDKIKVEREDQNISRPQDQLSGLQLLGVHLCRMTPYLGVSNAIGVRFPASQLHCSHELICVRMLLLQLI